MTKDEARIPNGRPAAETGRGVRPSSLRLRHSFVIRQSDFVIAYRRARDRLARSFPSTLPPVERRGKAAGLLARFIFLSCLRAKGLSANPVGQNEDDAARDLHDVLPWRQGDLSAEALASFSALLESLPEADGERRRTGAYSTGADVARHITRNTLIPFLLAALARRHDSVLGPDGELARLLRSDPDSYCPAERRSAFRRWLRAGRLGTVADLITWNIDLETLARDLLARAADPALRLTSRRTLETISVLDPTCGTGAFLLAALRVLGPLYRACLPPAEHSDILSRIVGDNLFGVDLMGEAIALCRLRLLLEVAGGAEKNEPLLEPRDSLRAGNVLASPAWWAEAFPAVMRRGGFDVVLGNPPYLELREVPYRPRGYACQRTGAVHALCVERGLELLQPDGYLSMVVPLAVASTRRMRPVQQLLEGNRDCWYAHFAWRPARLFPRVNRPITLFISARAGRGRTYSTCYRKWAARDRPRLMDRITFVEVPRDRPSFWVPKIGTDLERRLLEKCLRVPTTVADFILKHPSPDSPGRRVYYRTDGGLYWKVFTDFPPAFRGGGRAGHSTRETWLEVADAAHVASLIAVLSSDVFWWWYTITSNCRHLNPSDVYGFPLPASALADARLSQLGRRYLRDIARHSAMRVRRQRQTGHTETQSFRIRESRAIIEEIGAALAGHYGLSARQTRFLARYDLEFRMGLAAGSRHQKKSSQRESNRPGPSAVS